MPGAAFLQPCQHGIAGDNFTTAAYICGMRNAYWLIPLFALLAVALWFAGTAWSHLGNAAIDIPLYGYLALAGGVVVSLGIGGGLMALVFYSNRHGYDDLSGGDGDKA